jgi:hypothetical protein
MNKRFDIVDKCRTAGIAVTGSAPVLPGDLLEAATAVRQAKVEPVIRTLHHFACTGGSLLARALEAQDNVRVLSEIEPFSEMVLSRPRRAFAPTDTLGLARGATLGISDDLVVDLFMTSMECLLQGLHRSGQSLVLREHSHSRYCTHQGAMSKPLMRSLLQDRFKVHSILTVRHPIDSWLGLTQRSWVEFQPATLDEYSHRYSAFLDDHGGVAIVKYEDFVASPDVVVREMCAHLDLAPVDAWQSFLPAIRMTGDSGRSGHVIKPRARRAIPVETRRLIENSKPFAALCERLGYSLDLSVDDSK